MERWNEEDYQRLYEAILSLQTKEECQAFFADLLTISELNAMAQRLKVAEMLHQHQTCGTIAEATFASTTTVSRVNRCYAYGTGGYKMVLERIQKTKEK